VTDSRKVSREEYLRGIRDDIDPMKHAGEGWYATEEYARPDDIDSRYTRGEVGHEGAYYPRPAKKRRKK
jgi:hypothetical protein